MVSFTVGTANIQNFPDLSDKDMRFCVTQAKQKTDLALFQEIGDPADHLAISQIMAPDWSFTNVTVENVIVAKNSVLKPVGAPEVTKISEHLPTPPGHALLHSPTRYMTVQRYTWAAVTGLPDVCVIDIHYIQSAFNPAQMDFKPQRQALWADAHKFHGAKALELRAKGFIVIGGGDWNRHGADIPLFAKDQKWIIGGVDGIDHVYALLPTNVVLSLGNAGRFNSPSDHDLQTRTIGLVSTGLPPAQPMPVSTPKPVLKPGEPVIKPGAVPPIKPAPKPAPAPRLPRPGDGTVDWVGKYGAPIDHPWMARSLRWKVTNLGMTRKLDRWKSDYLAKMGR